VRVDVTPAAHKFAATLGSMRREFMHSKDPKHMVAADGLADLQTSVIKMAEANSQANPARASELLYAGIKAFESAQSKANEAGDAWPL
jgi:hypothetical protein